MMSPSTEAALAGLKDFQRKTVDYVFDRLYGPQAGERFLVADEVGLGKTLIARGVAARAIDHLRATVPRIDIIYICSNGDIARQNINRLRVDDGHQVLTTRLTMLPTDVRKLGATDKAGVNFVSFTPSTSFDVKGGLGKAEERILLYWMLRQAWGLGAAKAPINIFQGGVGTDRFRNLVDGFDVTTVDVQAQREFTDVLAAQPQLRADFEALSEAFSRAGREPSPEARSLRARFIGAMRTVLAKSCVKSLEPDLVILDEFQRFSHLLEGDDDASLLARELFSFKDVRVLMLSATPYKMYTQREDPQGEDHYRDFLRTVRFLEHGTGAPPIDPTLREYRESLYGISDPDGGDRLVKAKTALENRLRRVMVRTERLAATPDRNGMLVEVPATVGDLRSSDVSDYLALQTLARAIEHDDTVEYWKSAPYLLSFMGDNYALRRDVFSQLDTADGRALVARVLASSKNCNLTWSVVERYGEIDPGNARLRGLVEDVVERGAWKLLWVPPSMPYYRLGGVFADPKLAGFSKRLVFSSWVVVPRVIAGVMSYEAERRMYAGDPSAVNTPEARKARKPLLRFARSAGRLTGMPVLALLYPSLFLARMGDPLVLSVEHARERDGSVDLNAESADMLSVAKERIGASLRRLKLGAEDGPVDERWYWAAPLLLDRQLEPGATRAWFNQYSLAAEWSGADEEEAEAEEDDRDLWSEHVDEALAIARDPDAAKLGRMPPDLVDVLAQLALAGPAVAMFRAFERVVGGERKLEESARVALRNAAGRTASAFRTLFNQPEVIWMLRHGAHGAAELPYWRLALQYCVDGCLQAVLDEYVHVLKEHLGLMAGTIGERAGEIAEAISEALALRTSRIGVDDLTLSEAGRTVKQQARRNMRTHFALRFGDETNDDGTVVTRADQVRKAFNSPFWPFVVATTSVGQEGLDFHTYCHAVVHWNLPSNPVDLEQREGRVHRYKNHAVRKNVAAQHATAAIDGEAHDPWEASFSAAKAERPHDATDIVPYWVYPSVNGARIERHVPSLPLSRERAQMVALSRTLVFYRMVFGQPRQEDLVRHLRDVVDPASAASLLTVSLAP